MHHPTDKITHTTAFVTPVVEHWLEGEIGANVLLISKDRRSYVNLWEFILCSRCLGSKFRNWILLHQLDGT